MGKRRELNIIVQEHEGEAEEPLPRQPAQFDLGGTQNEQFYAEHNNQTEGEIQGEPFSSSSSFFQHSVLLTLILLLLDCYTEKEEHIGRDVLDGARCLVCGAAPTVCSRVRVAIRAAGRAAGPGAVAWQGA